GAASEVVLSEAAVEDVRLGAAPEPIGTTSPVEHVPAVEAADDVGLPGTDEMVIALGAVDRPGVRPGRGRRHRSRHGNRGESGEWKRDAVHGGPPSRDVHEYVTRKDAG